MQVRVRHGLVDKARVDRKAVRAGGHAADHVAVDVSPVVIIVYGRAATALVQSSTAAYVHRRVRGENRIADRRRSGAQIVQAPTTVCLVPVKRIVPHGGTAPLKIETAPQAVRHVRVEHIVPHRTVAAHQIRTTPVLSLVPIDRVLLQDQTIGTRAVAAATQGPDAVCLVIIDQVHLDRCHRASSDVQSGAVLAIHVSIADVEPGDGRRQILGDIDHPSLAVGIEDRWIAGRIARLPTAALIQVAAQQGHALVHVHDLGEALRAGYIGVHARGNPDLVSHSRLRDGVLDGSARLVRLRLGAVIALIYSTRRDISCAGNRPHCRPVVRDSPILDEVIAIPMKGHDHLCLLHGPDLGIGRDIHADHDLCVRLARRQLYGLWRDLSRTKAGHDRDLERVAPVAHIGDNVRIGHPLPGVGLTIVVGCDPRHSARRHDHVGDSRVKDRICIAGCRRHNQLPFRIHRHPRGDRHHSHDRDRVTRCHAGGRRRRHRGRPGRPSRRGIGRPGNHIVVDVKARIRQHVRIRDRCPRDRIRLGIILPPPVWLQGHIGTADDERIHDLIVVVQTTLQRPGCDAHLLVCLVDIHRHGDRDRIRSRLIHSHILYVRTKVENPTVRRTIVFAKADRKVILKCPRVGRDALVNHGRLGKLDGVGERRAHIDLCIRNVDIPPVSVCCRPIPPGGRRQPDRVLYIDRARRHLNPNPNQIGKRWIGPGWHSDIHRKRHGEPPRDRHHCEIPPLRLEIPDQLERVGQVAHIAYLERERVRLLRRP